MLFYQVVVLLYKFADNVNFWEVVQPVQFLKKYLWSLET